uniref:C-type lectin domain-containing protein n=1 Tax=Panagrolaimus sp. JU765 TaxID=591449 RepID=A0AC34R2B6_9BILA
MCYKYMTQPKITFPNAQGVCSNENANLVSIHSKKEHDFVMNMTQDATAENYLIEGTFIGLQYVNSEWKWVDGTDLDYENWGPNRPQYPANAKADGALVYPDGIADYPPTWSQKWDDTTFDLLLNRFVCKKKPNLMFVGENLNINI